MDKSSGWRYYWWRIRHAIEELLFPQLDDDRIEIRRLNDEISRLTAENDKLKLQLKKRNRQN